MRKFLALWRREVASYLASPVAYILAAMFLGVMGVGFWFLAAVRLLNGATFYEFMRALFGGVAWVGVLMVVPILSMRSFAEETRAGTLEMLLTAPVKDGQVVLSKFLGLLTVYMLIWVPTLIYFPLLEHVAGEELAFDAGALAAAYVGVALLGSLFLSIGLLCSALTENVILSAISCFAAIILIFLAGFLPEVSPVPALREWSEPVSPVLHMLEFSRGVIDTRAVVLYLSSTLLVLMITNRLLESRRWRT